MLQYTDEVMCRIAALLPPERRGIYAQHARVEGIVKPLKVNDFTRPGCHITKSPPDWNLQIFHYPFCQAIFPHRRSTRPAEKPSRGILLDPSPRTGCNPCAGGRELCPYLTSLPGLKMTISASDPGSSAPLRGYKPNIFAGLVDVSATNWLGVNFPDPTPVVQITGSLSSTPGKPFGI